MAFLSKQFFLSPSRRTASILIVAAIAGLAALALPCCRRSARRARDVLPGSEPGRLPRAADHRRAAATSSAGRIPEQQINQKVTNAKRSRATNLKLLQQAARAYTIQGAVNAVGNNGPRIVVLPGTATTRTRARRAHRLPGLPGRLRRGPRPGNFAISYEDHLQLPGTSGT